MKINESKDILKAAGFTVVKHVAKNKWFVENAHMKTSVYTDGLIMLAEMTEAFYVAKLDNMSM